MGRAIALILLLIPVIVSGYGIKLMRDAFFATIITPYPSLWIQFFVGVICFILGLAFMAGFIFHRDKKRGKVAARFLKKQNKRKG